MRIVTVLMLLVIIGCAKNDSVDDTAITLDQELINSLNKISSSGDYTYFTMPESDDYAALPNQDPQNPVTAAKVKLGKMLFFETALAQKPFKESCRETYSCGSCHIATSGFLPGRIQGIADGGIGHGQNGEGRQMQAGYDETDLDAQGTRPMNPLNSGYSTNSLWSGLFGATGVNVGTEYAWTGLAKVNFTGYVGLEAQNIEAFELHRLEINDKVLDNYGYRAYYDEAFPDFDESERYSPTTSSFAISAFLRTMLANKAPFQKWLKGDKNAMTASQKKGALLFFGKARCFTCHNSPALSSMTFHRLGTKDMYEIGGLNTGPDDIRNLGRGMFTGKEEDHYKFKVPQLYNLKDYAAYFHGSSKSTLADVITFKIKAVSENPNVTDDMLSSRFKSLTLTDQEVNDLLAFLRDGLYDPEPLRYLPSSVLSGNCIPNNDEMSRIELGCN